MKLLIVEDDVRVADFLQREVQGVAAYVDELREHSPFKTGD